MDMHKDQELEIYFILSTTGLQTKSVQSNLRYEQCPVPRRKDTRHPSIPGN